MHFQLIARYVFSRISPLSFGLFATTKNSLLSLSKVVWTAAFSSAKTTLIEEKELNTKVTTSKTDIIFLISITLLLIE